MVNRWAPRSTAARTRTAAGVTTTRNLYGTLLQRKAETDVVKGVTLSNASVMDPAELPMYPSYPRVSMNLAFGLLFGCAL